MTDCTPMVLYVDYDSGERTIAAATIEARGFRVRTATSALTAMELVQCKVSLSWLSITTFRI